MKKMRLLLVIFFAIQCSGSLFAMHDAHKVWRSDFDQCVSDFEQWSYGFKQREIAFKQKEIACLQVRLEQLEQYALVQDPSNSTINSMIKLCLLTSIGSSALAIVSMCSR